MQLTPTPDNEAVETLSDGQRQGVAVARAVAWGRRLVIMDEPTATLGVKESGMVLELIRRIRDGRLSVILVRHNMPHTPLASSGYSPTRHPAGTAR